MTNSYQITNNSASAWTSTSLTLAGHTATIMTVASTLPADLNPGIVSEQLTAVKVTSLTISDVDPTTDVSSVTVNAANSSQVISAAITTGLLPPGRQIVNNTGGEIAISCNNGIDASWASYTDTLAPGEFCYVAADYMNAITAFCDSTVGSITVRTFY